MEQVARLLSKYKNQGALIDSNLLLVYCVGVYDPDRIARFKRTAAFTREDFDLLTQFFSFFEKIVTTPNILSEVNSFSNQLSENLKPAYYPEFAKQISLLEEHYLPSAEISARASFERLGLTDLGIAKLVRDKYLVLSDDLRLVLHLQNNGIDGINFNHIRTLGWN
jgi:hypothetical protein